MHATLSRRCFLVLGTRGAAVSLIVAGCSSVEPRTEEAPADLVAAATTTLSNFTRDPDMTWFRDNLPAAQGLLIVPTFLRAGFVFGGAGGNGVLITRDSEGGSWSYPAFYTVAAGSVGLQAGAEVAEVILMIRSVRGRDAMLGNSLKLGADVGVAAGPVGAGARVATSDILAFSRSRGLYGGISLDGSVITTRDAWNAAYYGRAVRPVDILVSRTVSNPQAEPLRNLAARRA
ncbi:lipid-binding SYLF domain-containing protein [Skermanella rosea]|uniref:lipid-binding SYLF domain-containing protein n=1 Tax=Skermanella rosea TaxID=1817965 RepID=UPI001931658E|nr:lipid-binding SYLF domain-containing protein [Skermanella rosea]UEM03287.1 lipid-binding SYLF domain-containing protein [Skermanella rosea]